MKGEGIFWVVKRGVFKKIYGQTLNETSGDRLGCFMKIGAEPAPKCITVYLQPVIKVVRKAGVSQVEFVHLEREKAKGCVSMNGLGCILEA